MKKLVSKYSMFSNLIKLMVFIFIVHLSYFAGFAQTKDKKYIQELFDEIKADEKLVAECEQKIREFQIANFGRVLPKISGHCWDGCPINVVKPYYPIEAKRFRISGQVKVETIVDENGKVAFAKAVSGNILLRRVAEQAARVSKYQPKNTCDNNPIKFRWTIIYNFFLN